MDAPSFAPARIFRLSALWLIFILMPSALASYSVGVGIGDTTGPTAEIVFLGYARIDQKGSGLHLRTFSRAFIVDDGEERFVFVSVDSAMVGNDIRKEVLKKLKAEYDDLYTETNVMISATHTHSSPGGHMMYTLFDLTCFGFVKETFDAVVNGITKSIINAHNSVVPARIFIDHGEVLDANINRSPAAYLNNPKSEREKYKYDVDKTMALLRFVHADGKPLGSIAWFAVHPTSMNNTNHLVSSDNVGYASILLEKEMNRGALIGKGPFVAAFASSNLGDVSPNTRGPKCEFSGKPCSAQSTCGGAKERCFASGPGKDMFESTSIIANKLFTQALTTGLRGIRNFQLRSSLRAFASIKVLARWNDINGFYIVPQTRLGFTFFWKSRRRLRNTELDSTRKADLPKLRSINKRASSVIRSHVVFVRTFSYGSTDVDSITDARLEAPSARLLSVQCNWKPLPLNSFSRSTLPIVK
ncbi:hypothetical protein KM043_004878 [Ampulex compressa]|nr:hypothetical protein KM043_004878 [Ampulex compressa]